MTRMILASHHRMAEGLLDTLNYILPVHYPVCAVSAYLSDTPVEEDFKEVLKDADPNEQILILTDMMGGSVNQYCCRLLAEYPNLHIIAGMSLPLALSLALQASNGPLSSEEITALVDDCRGQLVYVNKAMQAAAEDEEDDE